MSVPINNENNRRKIYLDLEVDTSQVDAAVDKVSHLADAMRAFPPNVTIKGAKNCKINIYPSQTMIIERGESDEGEE